MCAQPRIVGGGPCNFKVLQGVPSEFECLSEPLAGCNPALDLLRFLPPKNFQGLLDLQAASTGIQQREQLQDVGHHQNARHAAPVAHDSRWGEDPLLDMKVHRAGLRVFDALQELRNQREQDASKLLRRGLLKPPFLNDPRRQNPPRPTGSRSDIHHARLRQAFQEKMVGDVAGTASAVAARNMAHADGRPHGVAREHCANGFASGTPSASQSTSEGAASQVIRGPELQPALQTKVESFGGPKKFINQEIKRLLASRRSNDSHVKPLSSAKQVGDPGVCTADAVEKVAKLKRQQAKNVCSDHHPMDVIKPKDAIKSSENEADLSPINGVVSQFIAKSTCVELQEKQHFSEPDLKYIVKNTFVEQSDGNEKYSWKHFLSEHDLPRFIKALSHGDLPVVEKLEEVLSPGLARPDYEPWKIETLSWDNLPTINSADDINSPRPLHKFQ